MLRNKLNHIAAEGAIRLEQWRAAFLILFSLVFLLSAGLLAAAKILWNDEISTSLFARLPALSDITAGLRLGADSHPPLSFLLTRWSYALLGVNPVAARLPAILGYWVLTLSVFAFVRSRANALYAAAASSFLLITPLVAYAYEARPYGILLGLTGLSLLVWQRTCQARGGRRALLLAALALTLAAAVSAHYFAVLLWIPLCAGELVRDFRARRLDWGVWLALAAGTLPLPFFLPLLRGLRATVGANFWARPSLVSSIEDTYRGMINLAMWPMIAAVLLWALLKPRRQAGDTKESPPLPLHERVAVLCLAGLPVFAVGLGFVIGGYTDRYAVPGLAGVAIALALLAYRASAADALLGAVLLATFGGWFLLKVPGTYRKLVAQRGSAITAAARPFDDRRWMAYASRSDLPLVATNSVFYSQLEFYAPPAIAPRLRYLADVQAALHYDRYTTGDAVMLLDRKLFSLPVEDYTAFVAAHPRFLLCANLSQPTWPLTRLLESGATLVLKARDADEVLFDVTLPKRDIARNEKRAGTGASRNLLIYSTFGKYRPPAHRFWDSVFESENRAANPTFAFQAAWRLGSWCPPRGCSGFKQWSRSLATFHNSALASGQLHPRTSL